ncbi:MAG: 2-dehydropantoate 2-reductase [Sulfurimonas sp.]|nr:2-dehydropantoate 2-reductase [Sulfurimonas sp.]
MRVAVVGLGGVGGYIGASLAKTSNEVVGFARGKHLDEIKKSGLKIVEDSSSWYVKIDARELSEADGYFDVVLFCVKSYDLKSSYEAISQHIDSNSVLISFSNGVSNGDELRKLTDSHVLDGCIYILSHIEKAGVIRKKGKVFAAVFGGEADSTKLLSQIFDEAKLRTKTPDDIKTAIWKKFIFISAFATLTSYYDKSIGYIYENHFNEAETLLKEIASVARAKGIEIFDEVEKALDVASKVPYDSSTSMYLDFQNKKQTELETLCGYIVKEAKIGEVQTPLMSKIYIKLQTI